MGFPGIAELLVLACVLLMWVGIPIAIVVLVIWLSKQKGNEIDSKSSD